MISFEYCPVLGLVWYKFEKQLPSESNKSSKRKTRGNNEK